MVDVFGMFWYDDAYVMEGVEGDENVRDPRCDVSSWNAGKCRA